MSEKNRKANMTSFTVQDLGTIAYDTAFDLQKRTVERLQNGDGEEMLYLLEHPHVITLGRNASGTNLVAGPSLFEERGATVVDTDRGGDITYHGPGQLVGYPVIQLEEGRRDIRRYVNDVEEVLIRTLGEFGIEGTRHPVHRGAWTGGRKIASVGIRISRWVTSHGFALNVSTDLSYFQLINPCGIDGVDMTSIERELDHPVEMQAVKQTYVNHFADVFERTATDPIIEGAPNG
jgi:lipoyl(octanoyl) transferase